MIGITRAVCLCVAGRHTHRVDANLLCADQEYLIAAGAGQQRELYGRLGLDGTVLLDRSHLVYRQEHLPIIVDRHRLYT